MLGKVLFALLLLSTTAAQAAPTLLVFGDSLSAGYGLDAGHGWVALLSQKLKSMDSPYTVVNASISGETSAGGAARLRDALNQYTPVIVLIELGANDGLRGQPPQAMRANLEQMIDLTRAHGAQPVLFEMRIPSNYGPVYNQRFTQTFREVADEKHIPLVPFFLGDIAADRARWFQEDGLHPNEAAQPRLLETVWRTLAPLLAHAPASGGRPRP